MLVDFSALSPSEFEALSADLIGRALGIRFEQFGEGADGGIDGRYAPQAESLTILQAKRYERSAIAALKSEMSKERAKIDKLAPDRYILATSVAMTPQRKQDLMEICGPAIRSPGNIFGREDLEALLRAHPDIEEAHPKLWTPASGRILKRMLNETMDEREGRAKPPSILQALLPKPDTGSKEEAEAEAQRDTLFLVGARPDHDQFILWLGPKLEAHGYRVFSEILTLEPGDRWHKEIGVALEHRAAKVLAVAGAATRANEDAMDLIDRAKALAASLGDARLIIPLRIEEGAKIDGLRDATPADFTSGWAEGLSKLLETLRRQGVTCRRENITVAAQWESFRKRGAVPLVREPESLVSNWIQILEMPDELHFYEVTGALQTGVLKRAFGSGQGKGAQLVSRAWSPRRLVGRGLRGFRAGLRDPRHPSEDHPRPPDGRRDAGQALHLVLRLLEPGRRGLLRGLLVPRQGRGRAHPGLRAHGRDAARHRRPAAGHPAAELLPARRRGQSP